MLCSSKFNFSERTNFARVNMSCKLDGLVSDITLRRTRDQSAVLVQSRFCADCFNQDMYQILDLSCPASLTKASENIMRKNGEVTTGITESFAHSRHTIQMDLAMETPASAVYVRQNHSKATHQRHH